MPTWTLEPRNVFTPDPACPHCVNHPGYQHRHWRQQEGPAPQQQPGRIWRALFKVMGDGSQTR